MDIAFGDCPPEVRDRWLAVAFVFQHWQLDEVDRLVENGRAVASEYADDVRALFNCAPDELVLTRVIGDVWESGACRFATDQPSESVYDVTAGPLLGSDEPYSPRTFISFRLRFHEDRQELVGKAFDFAYEIT